MSLRKFSEIFESTITGEEIPFQYVDGLIRLKDDEEFIELKRYSITMLSFPIVIFTFIFDKINKTGYIYCLGLNEPFKFTKILFKEKYESESEALKDMEKNYTSFVFS